jgi:hypothetical protein
VPDRLPTRKLSPQQAHCWLTPAWQSRLHEDMKNKSARVQAVSRIEGERSITFPIIHLTLHVVQIVKHPLGRGPGIRIIASHQSHSHLGSSCRRRWIRSSNYNRRFLFSRIGWLCGIGYPTTKSISAQHHIRA